MAQGELLTAEPMPGTTLTAAPAENNLSFGEPLATKGTFLMWGENFQQLPDIGAAVDLQSPKQLVAPVPSLTPGPYTFPRTPGANDGDSSGGSYSFSLVTKTERSGAPINWWMVPAVVLVSILLIASFQQRRRLGVMQICIV